MRFFLRISKKNEWPFGKAMVDDADAVKNITVSWTNIVASVFSTDSHFSASLASVGMRTATKYLHAGKVYIYYDGSTYDADGKRIK